MRTFLCPARCQNTNNRTAIAVIGTMRDFDVMMIGQQIIGCIETNPTNTRNQCFNPGVQLA